MAHGSITRDSNPPVDALALLSVTDVERKRGARALRDSVDLLIDPRLAAMSAPSRRISSIPHIAVAPIAYGKPAVEIAAPAPSSIEAPQSLVSIAPTRGHRAARASHFIAWAVAAVASITIGGVTGRMTRPHSRTRPVATTRLAADAHQQTQTPSIRIAQASQSIGQVRARVASPTVQLAQAPGDEVPSRVHEETTSQTRAHAAGRTSSRSNGIAAAAPATVAELTAPSPPAPVEPAPVPVAAPTAAAPTNESCASRCGEDLACAAACVVHGNHDATTGTTSVESTPPISAPESAPVAAAAIPDGPTRQDVMHAIQSVLPAVRACGADEENSVAHVTMTFASSGRITTANTESPYAGTPSGSCIARAVRDATVPPFSRSTFTVRAPFVMR